MNQVDCKRCAKLFNYSPGPKHNKPQLCEVCCSKVDMAEVERLQEESIVEDNKYLRKDQYDCLEILNGTFPELNSDAERTIAAVEFAQFIGRVGFGGQETNVVRFMKYLGHVHMTLFASRLPLNILEQMSNSEVCGPIVKQMYGIV